MKHFFLIVLISQFLTIVPAQNEWKLSRDSSSKVRYSDFDAGLTYSILNFEDLNNTLTYENLPGLNNSAFGISVNLSYKEVDGVGEYDHIHWKLGSKFNYQRFISSNDSLESQLRFGNYSVNFLWDLLGENKERSIFVGGGLGLARYELNTSSTNIDSFIGSLTDLESSSILNKHDFTGSLLCSFSISNASIVSISYNFNLIDGSWRQSKNKISGGPDFGLGFLQLGLFTHF